MTILLSIAVLGTLGMVAGGILALAFSRLKVEENPQVEKILNVLPSVNCGACGYASCLAYAEAVAEGKAESDKCAPGGEDVAVKILEIKGKKAPSQRKTPEKAVVRCRPSERKFSASYKGIKTCRAANISGGGMLCRFGCLGYGDCLRACPFDALIINNSGVAEVLTEKCTGCGLCVRSCPRGIIHMKPHLQQRSVFVGCSNTQKGKYTRKVCASGCIACRLCVKRAPEGSFVVENNLARVENQSEEINREEIKCPTGCIYQSIE